MKVTGLQGHKIFDKTAKISANAHEMIKPLKFWNSSILNYAVIYLGATCHNFNCYFEGFVQLFKHIMYVAINSQLSINQATLFLIALEFHLFYRWCVVRKDTPPYI